MAWKIDSDDNAYAIRQSGQAARWGFIAVTLLVAALAAGAPARVSLVERSVPLVAWLVGAYASRSLTINIDARFDRPAQRVTIHGSRWFSKSWSVDAPLSEIERVEVGSDYGASRRRVGLLRLRLRDGRTPMLWVPVAVTDVAGRAAELEAWLARANPRV